MEPVSKQQTASVSEQPDRDTAVDLGNWALLVDPSWQAESEGQAPPAEMMVGGWRLDAEGKPERFRPNPDYVPPTEDGATDPLDAVLRLIARDGSPVDALLPTFRDAFVEVAVSAEGDLMVGPAPDGAQCVAVVTAGVHSKQLPFERWVQVTAEQLLAGLPEGIDILINAAGPTPFRLSAEALRASVARDPENKEIPAAAAAPDQPTDSVESSSAV